jgi:hypothetical protein
MWLYRAGTISSCTALECTTLIFGKSAPYSSVLSTFKGPGETGFAHDATVTDFLRLFDLSDRRAGVTDWEEEFRVFIAAC